MTESKADETTDTPRDDALEKRDRDDEPSPAVKASVETAANVYYETCRKIARTINRLKSSLDD